MANNENPSPMPTPAPDPALKRLEKLVGTWALTGRTLNAAEDNITGWTTFEWLPGEFFLKSFGEITFQGILIQSLEIIAYDPKSRTFRSNVYSNLSGDVLSYAWDMQGNTVIHAGLGAKYTGTFSTDGNTLTGGWRPDDGTASSNDNTYDAVMTRVK